MGIKVTDFTPFEELVGQGEYDTLEGVIFALSRNYIEELIYIPWEEGEDYKTYQQKQKDVMNNKYGYEHIECDGGEGCGDWASGVFRFKGKIYKANYACQSYSVFYYDSICDDLYEVEKKTREIVVYE